MLEKTGLHASIYLEEGPNDREGIALLDKCGINFADHGGNGFFDYPIDPRIMSIGPVKYTGIVSRVYKQKFLFGTETSEVAGAMVFAQLDGLYSILYMTVASDIRDIGPTAIAASLIECLKNILYRRWEWVEIRVLVDERSELLIPKFYAEQGFDSKLIPPAEEHKRDRDAVYLMTYEYNHSCPHPGYTKQNRIRDFL